MRDRLVPIELYPYRTAYGKRPSVTTHQTPLPESFRRIRHHSAESDSTSVVSDRSATNEIDPEDLCMRQNKLRVFPKAVQLHESHSDRNSK